VDGGEGGDVGRFVGGEVLRAGQDGLQKGQFAEGVAAVAHDAAGEGHLALEVRVAGGEAVEVGRLGEEEGVALFDLEAGEDLAGEDDAGGTADGGEFQLYYGRSPFEPDIVTIVIMWGGGFVRSGRVPPIVNVAAGTQKRAHKVAAYVLEQE